MQSERDDTDQVFLLASEVAQALRVGVSTVKRGCEIGEYRGAFRVGKRRQWRIPLKALPVSAQATARRIVGKKQAASSHREEAAQP